MPPPNHPPTHVPTTHAQVWQVGPNQALALEQPQLIGILNVTPDSFSDGGKYRDPDAALRHALRMHEEGARIIDIGGESTRPGAAGIPPQEQIARTQPVIESIRAQLDSDALLLSIDTTSSEVARAALDCGANIINDISAGADDAHMLALAAAQQCGIILVHRRTPPQRDSYSHQYVSEPDYGGDVVSAVRDYLRQRRDAATAHGIRPAAIVLDPGLGFGKSIAQNYQLAGRIRELGALNSHLLSAASRKSFIGAVSGEEIPARRIAGTLAVSVYHYLAGVRLFRVHDVAEHQQALATAAATLSPPPQNGAGAGPNALRQSGISAG